MELPEEDELVLIVIKKILPYGAFCVLTEYNNLEAFLHVSEVAPRWIKNIHEFISEGQRHVAKIHRVDHQKNQIDVSLKRVSEEEKRKKLQLVRSEKRADKLLELALANSREKITPFQARTILEEHVGDVFGAFQKAAEDPSALDAVPLPSSLKEALVEIAKKNIKKPSVQVSGVIHLTCYAENGIEVIQRLFKREEPHLGIQYLGAPRYLLTLTAGTYKEADKQLQRVMEDIKTMSEKSKCDVSFEKKK